MQELLQHQPSTSAEFKVWCQDGISLLEGNLDGDLTSEMRSFAAALVVRAKVHAYRITAYDLADVLPARDEKNPVDALLRLRECLEWLESGGPVADVGDGPYTVAQIAHLLNLSERHVYDLVNEGALYCQRHGRAIRVTREQLEQYQRGTERARIRTTGFRHL